MSNPVGDAAQPDRAAFEALDRAIGDLLARLTWLHDRAALAEEKSEDLEEMLASDPYAEFRLAKGSKRVVTFLREPTAAKLDLPISKDGARILTAAEREVFTAYVPSPRGGSFMKVIEDAYGQAVTTRTWETVKKVAARCAT